MLPMPMHFSQLRILAAGLALATAGLAPLSAAVAANSPSVDTLVASAKSRTGVLNPSRLTDAIESATSDPAQRAELAKAVAEAAVQLAATDPQAAAMMVYAATQVVKAPAVSNAAPQAALAIGNATVAVAKNPAVLADSRAVSIVDGAVVNTARIARNIASSDSSGAATLAESARTAATGVDTARGLGTTSVERAVVALTGTFVTSQTAGDASPSGLGSP